MVITDIKNTKIKVENEDHSKAIQEAAFKLGFRWGSGDKYVQNTERKSLFFWASERIYIPSVEVFEGNDGCEIFFYNGEFHDKPQGEVDLDVSGQLDKLLESIKDESEAKKEKIKSLEKGLEKLSALGYEYHNGEWLSKEEIAAKERECELHEIAEFMKQDKSPSDCEAIYNYITYKGYRKGEL